MKIERLWHSSGGQALTELTVILPVGFILLAAPLHFWKTMEQRVGDDTRRLDENLAQFAKKESVFLNNLRSQACLRQAGTGAKSTATPSTRWPEEVDKQRALSLSLLRVSCLGEGTAKHGPKVALPLWSVHIAAPSEAAARATAQTLCPGVVAVSEKLRASVASAHKVRLLADAAPAAQVLRQTTQFCLTGLKSVRPLDSLFAGILDP
ncbi:MAG: hypothetical protein RLZZ488_857 [Pseudomonadota bacterium]|jgi:hypothetical protein